MLQRTPVGKRIRQYFLECEQMAWAAYNAGALGKAEAFRLRELENMEARIEARVRGRLEREFKALAVDNLAILNAQFAALEVRTLAAMGKNSPLPILPPKPTQVEPPLNIGRITFADGPEAKPRPKPKQEFMTVGEYKRAHDRKWRLPFCIKIGKYISAYCRANGYKICRVPDKQYGRVNAYPVEAWDKFMKLDYWRYDS